jgi:AcrR family transcriptional regulator
MVQKKKPEVREAILAAAYDLFRERGYTLSTIGAIARAADISAANIYVYFDSKLDILLELYEPWLMERIDALHARVQGLPDHEERLRALLQALWHDLPAEENGFASNLVQALATAPEDDARIRDLSQRAEARIAEILVDTLPEDRRHIAGDGALARLLAVATDGFSVNHADDGAARLTRATVDVVADLMLGRPG